MKWAENECPDCGRRLIRVADKKGVRYWEAKIKKYKKEKEEDTLRLRGFTQLENGYLVRINHFSPPVAEVWGKSFPLADRYWLKLCPLCQARKIREIRKRREKKL